MELDIEDDCWSSRRNFIMIILCQLMGTIALNRIPSTALLEGALGYILVLIIFQVSVGIPLMYMEFIVGQFTQRDCIDVWKIRPCFSHIGYFFIVWQVCILLCNHTLTSFMIHYFLITFEKPVPYYTCGHWSTNDCNILVTNFTVNQDCIKHQGTRSYCANIYLTFPEYQYFRLNLIRHKAGELQIAWKVLLASSLNCMFLYGSCLKRRKSLSWSVGFLTIYPLISVIFLLLGSMRQKGIVIKCVDALGLDFKKFETSFDITNLAQQIVYSLGVGTGITFNLASSSSFRTPCFSNTVISVVVFTVFTSFCILTIVMTTCPYAYVYGISPDSILDVPMTLTFEKLPRLLYEYDYRLVYLLLVFSCYTVLGLCTSVIIFYNLLEIIFKRNPKIMKYPGFASLCGIILLFFITIPLFSDFGINYIAIQFRQYFTLMSTFLALLEIIVFVISYGINKFSEDAHFMLGIQPNIWMKLAWIMTFVILAYTFCMELHNQITLTCTRTSIYTVLIISTIIILSCCFKFFIALCQKKILEIVTLDPTWGPKCDVLQRSRAMFTAQAMTKEYMYRQYHLQAGIISRQRKSNVRNTY